MSPQPLGEERVACVLPSPRTAATRWPATHTAPIIGPDVLEVRARPEEGKKGVSTLVSAGDTRWWGPPGKHSHSPWHLSPDSGSRSCTTPQKGKASPSSSPVVTRRAQNPNAGLRKSDAIHPADPRP